MKEYSKPDIQIDTKNFQLEQINQAIFNSEKKLNYNEWSNRISELKFATLQLYLYHDKDVKKKKKIQLEFWIQK